MSVRRAGPLLGLVCVALAVAAAVPSPASATGTTAVPEALTAPPAPVTPLATAISEALARADRLLPADPVAPQAGELSDARAFYAGRGFEPLWVTETGLTPRGDALTGELRRAADWGLNPSEFPVPGVDNAGALAALARSELALTGAALKYARHARGGRIADPGALLSGFIDRRPQLLPPSAVLATLATAPAVDVALRGFNPQHRQFELLRQAYLKARDGNRSDARASDARAVVLPQGPSLKPGSSHPDIALLRRRLGVAAPAEASPERFDPELVQAVKAFQAAAGLKADAVVGDRTRKALNAPLAATAGTGVDRLLSNMEQWRWMPSDLGATRIEVNIPEQQVRLFKDGRMIHAERVIVGKTNTATPVFSDLMETVVFQPKWGVPDSIKINELLPDLQAGYGLKRGLKMSLNGREIDPWNVDWSRADIKQYLVYQPSGDDNALGVVKFLFPNKHSVYLHDTPNKRLFSNEGRLYSHGCVRVRNPVRLAELILESDKGWDPSAVRDLLEDGPEDNPVRLDRKIPVHITYFTARADEALNVETAADVYGHEKRISLALQGRFDKIVKLDPQPVEVKPVAPRPEIARQPADEWEFADAGLFGSAAGVRVNGRYQPPAGLGYYYAQPSQPSQPSSQGSSGGARYRGNTTNDVIMRALGGY